MKKRKNAYTGDVRRKALTTPSELTHSTQLKEITTWTDQWPAYSGYEPLDPGQQEIRLIDLTMSDHGTLCMSLQHVSLEASPEYYALSYCWDPPVTEQNQCTLEVNGADVRVRPTLATFLSNLVNSAGPMTVWLDAICIDQRNLEEKKEQVRLMGNIYAQSLKTYAWLGEGTPETDYICQSFIETVYPVQDEDHDSYILQILRRPYWSRMWIVQEYALSKIVILVIGTYMIDAKKFLRSVPEHILNGTTLWSLARCQAATNQNFAMPLLRPKVEEPSLQLERLSDLMFEFRGLRCLDRRDKIYSLLSLAHTGLEPDYTSPAFQSIFWMTHALLSSCERIKEFATLDAVYRQLKFFRKLSHCVQPSIKDLMNTLRLPDLSFATTLELFAQINPTTHGNALSLLQIRTDVSSERFYFHDSFHFPSQAAVMFQLPIQRFHTTFPVPDFCVAVYAQSGKHNVGVGFHSSVIGRSIHAPEKRLSVRDACLLAGILSKGISLCHQTRSGQYYQFHISKLVFAIFSLIDREVVNHDTYGYKDQSPDAILRGFLAYLKVYGLTICEASEDCRSTNGAFSSSSRFFDRHFASEISPGVSLEWMKALRSPAVESHTFNRVEEDRFLAQEGFRARDVAFSRNFRDWFR